MSVSVDHPVVAADQDEVARHVTTLEAIPSILIPVLRTTPYLFATWLEDRSRHPVRVRLHLTDGEQQGLLYTRRPHHSVPSPDARKIPMDLTGIVIGGGTAEYLDAPTVPFSTVHHVMSVARLEVIQLGPDTSELTAECLNPFFFDAFSALLRDIAERWTEAAERIGGYLRSLDTPQPAGLDQDSALTVAEGYRPSVLPAPGEVKDVWEVITNRCNRQMVKEWWDGSDKGEIARRRGLRAKTVENLFSNLRREYGVDVVPLAGDKRRKSAGR